MPGEWTEASLKLLTGARIVPVFPTREKPKETFPPNPNPFMKHRTRFLLLVPLFTFCTVLVGQGRAFLGPGAEVRETFDWSAGSTLQGLAWQQNADQDWALTGTTQHGWYAGFNDDPASVTIGNGTSNNGGGVLSNFFYVSGDTDRSLGGRPTGGGGPLRLALRLTNTSDQTLSRFTISYAAEVTQQRDASVTNTVTFGYSLEATESNWRDHAFTEPGAAFNAATPAMAPSSNVDGNGEDNRSVVANQTVEGIAWEPGTDLWLRWVAPNVASGPNIGLDDVVFTAQGDGQAPPVRPTELAITPTGNTTLDLSWTDNSSDETGFLLERKAGDGDFVEIFAGPPDFTFYRDSGLSPDTEYTYRVFAVRDEFRSQPSQTVSWLVQLLPPTAPQELTVRTVSWTSLHLTWQRSDYNAHGFELQRRMEGEWTELARIEDITTLSYTDSPLPADTTFRYRIRAYNDHGTSDWAEFPQGRTEAIPETLAVGSDPIPASAIDHVLHTDPQTGDDQSGTGTPEAPFRTINKAISVARTHNAAGEGVTIMLHPGTYLESTPNHSVDIGAINLSGYWTTEAPLIIEGAGWSPGTHTGDVIITGAEEWSDWSNKDGDGVQSKAWPYDWGVNPRGQGPAPDVINRMELIWVNEPERGWRNYVQVTGPDQNAILNNLSPDRGFFWVDEENDRIRVVPPADVDLNDPNVVVRVTTRKRLLHHWRPQTSTSRTPLALRNLVFEHSGTIACYFQNVRHITVEDCEFRRNKIDGFSNNSFGEVFWTLRRCRFYENGVSGFSGGGSFFLGEDLEVHDNGWLAYVSNYTGWANQGMKVAEMYHSSLRNWRVWNNWGVGVWLDTGIYKTEVASMRVWGNRSSGIFLENNNRNTIEGLGATPTVMVRDSIFFDNDSAGTSLLGRGLAIAENENARFTNVVAVNNERQLAVASNVRGSTYHTALSHSLLGAAEPRLNGLYYPRNGLRDWQEFFDTLGSSTDDNLYIMEIEEAFTGRNGEALTFAEWQQAQFGNPFNERPDKAVDANSRFLQESYANQPLVNIFPLRETVTEGEGPVPAFAVYRLGPDVSKPLDIAVQVVPGPDAMVNADGQLNTVLPDSVTIPAGESRVILEVDPAADGLIEGRQQLSLVISTESASFSTQSNAAISVLDADLPADSAEVFLHPFSDPAEGGRAITVTAERIGNRSSSLDVPFHLTGSPDPAAEVSTSANAFRFAPGAATATIELQAVDDSTPEVTRDAVMELLPDSGRSYLPVAPSRLSFSIRDNDLAVTTTLNRAVSPGESGIRVPVELHNPTGRTVQFELRWPDGEWIKVDSRQDEGLRYQWEDNTSAANRIDFNWNSLNDDGNSDELPLGFRVPFFDASFSTATVHSNGFFTFGPLTNAYRRYGIPLQLPDKSLNTAPNMVAPFWTDFSLSPPAAVYFSTTARKALITWDRVAFAGNELTFQAAVNPTGVLTFTYKDADVTGTPSAGIQNQTKEQGLSLAFSEPMASSGYAVALVPNTAWITQNDFPIEIPPGESQTVVFQLKATGLAGARYIRPFTIVPGHPDLASQEELLQLEVSDQWIEQDAGWVLLDWMGWVYSHPGPFSYHQQLGFLYSRPSSPDAIRLYSFKREKWFFTARSLFPWAWDYSDQEWRKLN